MDMNQNNELHENSDSDQMEEILFNPLSVEHWIQTENVRSLFLSMMFENGNLRWPFTDAQDRVSGLIAWSEHANLIILHFISFFRQIDGFEGLHGDDRFILIKYNLLPLFPILKCYNYKATDDCYSPGDIEYAQKIRRIFILLDQSIDLHDRFSNLVFSLVEVTEQDPTILSLLLIILLFSQGLSINGDEPPLKDPLAVSRAQLHYTELLWQCLVNKWDEIEASRRFTQLFFIIIRMQSVAKRSREFFRVQILKRVTVDRISPLIQSVLHIS
jgi:hypothetical protein